jgi:hypothetical protein
MPAKLADWRRGSSPIFSLKQRQPVKPPRWPSTSSSSCPEQGRSKDKHRLRNPSRAERDPTPAPDIAPSGRHVSLLTVLTQSGTNAAVVRQTLRRLLEPHTVPEDEAQQRCIPTITTAAIPALWSAPSPLHSGRRRVAGPVFLLVALQMPSSYSICTSQLMWLPGQLSVIVARLSGSRTGPSCSGHSDFHHQAFSSVAHCLHLGVHDRRSREPSQSSSPGSLPPIPTLQRVPGQLATV